VGGDIAVHHQSDREYSLHADLRRIAESISGDVGHCDRTRNDHLDDYGDLAAAPMGGIRAGAVSGLGQYCHGGTNRPAFVKPLNEDCKHRCSSPYSSFHFPKRKRSAHLPITHILGG